VPGAAIIGRVSSLREARAGALTVAPMLLGVVPFGLVAGAAPVAEGLSGWDAVGLSTVVFAGASQLAIVDVLGQGGSALVAVLAAWTINLRMVLYSASLAPYLGHEPTRRRLAAAYLLVDQAYAASVSRWAGDDRPEGRLAYFVGAGALLWTSWQVSTVGGVLVGASVPADVPLDFAVPLVFLVLLVPVLDGRPALVAAAVGGVAGVVAAELGAGPLSTVVGAVAGIAAGAAADARGDHRPVP
jgi:predicted branched-subunit amino acid permease